jgi:hypothetical protein
MKLYQIIFLLVPFIMFSCEKEIQVTIPDRVPRLVINATLVPYTLPSGKYLGVNVSSSKHIFDSTTNTQLSNAIVLLYRNNLFFDTLHYKLVDNRSFYPLGFNPLAGPETGETYKLVVSADGFETVNAKTIIPPKVEILDVSIDRIAFFDENNLVFSKLTLTFNDSDSINYYEVVASSIGQEYNDVNYFPLTTYEPFIIGESHYPPAIRFDLKKPQYLLFNDKSFNGKKAKVDFYFQAAQRKGSQNVLLSDIISIQLRNVSEDYYKYRSSLLQSSFNNQEDILYGMGEPMNVYSNVEHGYGIFAGYNNSIKSLALEEIIFK